MSYVTSTQYESLIPLPVSLPLTEIEPEQWLVVSSTVLSSAQSFTLTWLQMNLLSFLDNSTTADTASISPVDGVCVFPTSDATLVTPGYGLAYVGLYYNFNALVSPNTQAAQENPLIIGSATTNTPPLYAARSTTPATYSAAGPYSFVICNNTTTWSLRLTVTGQIVMSLGPA
jgi:hypothetical protein